jgi:hypothetical protein
MSNSFSGLLEWLNGYRLHPTGNLSEWYFEINSSPQAA